MIAYVIIPILVVIALTIGLFASSLGTDRQPPEPPKLVSHDPPTIRDVQKNNDRLEDYSYTCDEVLADMRDAVGRASG